MCLFANMGVRPITTRISGHTRKVFQRTGRRVNSNNVITINPIESIVRQRTHIKTTKPDFRNSNLVEISCQQPTSGISHSVSKFAVLNARSIRSKTDRIKDELFFEHIDILGLTETWLTETSVFDVSDITPSGYDFVHVDRAAKQGGGVGLICRKQYCPRLLSSKQYSTFEHCHVELRYDSKQVHILIIYRPPSSVINDFLSEFNDVLEDVCLGSPPLILAGDFNVHYENENELSTQKYKDILDTFNLKQHVNSATHIKGHVLDHIITKAEAHFSCFWCYHRLSNI